MKTMFKRRSTSRVGKGAPSGFVVSLVFHAAVFLLAGIFIVFKVMPKPPPVFKAPPPVERPKMHLKKPKVRVQKSSTPKPSSRIVAKVKSAKMPAIQLPDLMGTGEGLMGGTGLGGDFLDMPSIPEVSIYGTEVSAGNDLIGTFYDFKRRRNGNPLGYGDQLGYRLMEIFNKFIASGWDKEAFARYYQAPRKLYTTTMVIAETPSLTAPKAFGVDTPGFLWGVLYEGELVSYKDIRFRFWGMGDNFMFVGVDHKTVLAYWLGSTGDPTASAFFGKYVKWNQSGITPMTYAYGRNGAWIDLKAGVPKKIQILIGESDGGGSSFMLCVEVAGKRYPLNPFLGGRTLPIFQMSVQSRTQVEDLQRAIYPGDATVNQGPIFQDYKPRPVTVPTNAVEEAAEATRPEPKENPVRTWTSIHGKTLQAALRTYMGDRVWLTTKDGREVKLFTRELCDADRKYLELSNPPKLKIRFSHRSDQQPLPPQAPGRDYSRRPVKITDYKFGAEVQLTDNRTYHYPLTVEYFAIGQELDGNNYVMWQRGSKTFTPSKANNYKVEFYGSKIERIQSTMYNTARMRGEKYGQYLVTVTDQRGVVVGYRESKNWFYKYLDFMKTLPITRHFNNKGQRVAPPRPIDSDRLWATGSGGVFDRTSD